MMTLDWVLKTFLSNVNQLTGFYLTQIFTERCFQTDYRTLGFNSNNSTKYIQTSRCKNPHQIWQNLRCDKNPHEKFSLEKKSSSLLFKKTMPRLVQGYIGWSFSFISPKWQIDEKVNLWNSCTLFTDKFATFLWYIGTPFSNGKNKVTGQTKHAVKSGNGCYWMNEWNTFYFKTEIYNLPSYEIQFIVLI